MSTMPWIASSPPGAEDRGAEDLASSPASATTFISPCVSPFSTARPTRVIGRRETRSGRPARARLGLGHADAAERRIDVERVGGDAVADPAALAVEQVGGDDLEIVIGGVGEGAAAVAFAERPDAGHVGGEAVVDLDIAALVGRDPGRLQAEIVGIGPAADGEQDMAALDLGRAVGAVEADRRAGEQPDAFGAGADDDPLGLEDRRGPLRKSPRPRA